MDGDEAEVIEGTWSELLKLMNNDVKTVTELVQKAVEMGFYVVDAKDPTNANKVVYYVDGSNILPAAPPAPPLSGQLLPAPATQEILGNFCLSPRDSHVYSFIP